MATVSVKMNYLKRRLQKTCFKYKRKDGFIERDELFSFMRLDRRNYLKSTKKVAVLIFPFILFGVGAETHRMGIILGRFTQIMRCHANLPE